MKNLYFKGLVSGEFVFTFESAIGRTGVNVQDETGREVDYFSYSGDQGCGFEGYEKFAELCEEYIKEVENGER